jgi:hypothetical protein
MRIARITAIAAGVIIILSAHLNHAFHPEWTNMQALINQWHIYLTGSMMLIGSYLTRSHE